MKSFLCALVLCVATAWRKDEGPVTRVVGLLEDLKERIGKDGKTEQASYNEYACWCEKTTAKTAATIISVKDLLTDTGNTILRLKGKVAVLTSEIAGLKADIKKNLEQQEMTTNIRVKENNAFMAESAELQQAISALQKAIVILGEATTPGSKKESFVQTSKWGSTMADLVSKMSKASLSTKLTEKQISLLGELSGNKHGSSYAPQSATIQGILQDMYTTMTKNLQASIADEARSYRNYEDLMATYQKQLATLQEDLVKKQDAKTEVEIQLADATQTYADSEEQLKAETELFDATKASCTQKTKEWSTRSSLRTAELEGIEKALEILTSDEAKELFAKAVKPGFSGGGGASFVQVTSHVNAGTAADKAIEALEKRARESHSFRLASLAAMVASEKDGGHFGKVIEMIDKLILQLQKEEEADIKKVDNCKEQYQDITQNKNDLEWKIKNNKAKVQKHETAIEQKEEAKTQTIADISDAELLLKKMLKERTAENTDYVAAKEDDEKAIQLLEKAKDALAKYFEENALLQQDPEPDMKLSDKNSAALQTKGVTSLLATIITDLTQELAESKSAEASSQADYETMKAAVEDQKDKLTKKKINLEGQLAEEDKQKTAEENLQGENEVSLTTEEETEVDLKKTCDDAIRLQPDRRAKRKIEVGGLTDAKEFLAGMSSDALIQTPRQEPSKNAFPSFTALSFMQRK